MITAEVISQRRLSLYACSVGTLKQRPLR
jgi:hypothetical protein